MNIKKDHEKITIKIYGREGIKVATIRQNPLQPVLVLLQGGP
jgi:hypothetical protein